jgi:uncharacterized membrane protein (UPF0182 family)
MRSPLPRVSRRGKVAIAVVGVTLVLLIFADQIVDLWTDWLWFKEVNYQAVFGGLLRTQIWLFLLFGLGIGGFVAGNLYLAFRVRPLLRANSPEQQALERYRMVLSPRLGLWTILVGGVVGLFAGFSGSGHWQQWMLFRNGGDFGITDPQFGVDIGFYVFKFPFYRYLLNVGFTATALAILGAVAVHYLYGGVRLQGVGDRMSTGARIHITSLVALFVVLKAVAYWLDKRELLLGFNDGTDLYGAGYTDINAVLPAKEILTWISVVVAVAILVFANSAMRNLVWAGASLALLGIAAVAIGGIYPTIVQQFQVKPNLRDKEAQYIGRTIEATRSAYGIGTVDDKAYNAEDAPAPASLATDTTIVPTIRLLDPAVVNETFSQYQQIRSFYNFNEKLDVDRYTVDGRLQDFVVGVREVDYSKLVGPQTNWLNSHTVFTHGYGFVAAPANTICEGAPVFVSGLLATGTGTQQVGSCQPTTETIKVDQPRIYYGELATDDDYVVVGKQQEFDRPAGASETQFTYDGAGGVPISSMMNRLLYSLHFREANFLLSDVFSDNSKLIYIRNPRERVEKVAPFLTLDGDPYPAVIDGKVTWILDGYTTSASYPYSERVDLRAASSDSTSDRGTVLQAKQNINYIRNSVKATVDAYNGTVTLYSFDDSDPILKAWNKAFGGNIIKPSKDIPPQLAEHFRYPEDLFKVQRDLLSKFHVSDPKQFNSGQDFWQVPDDPAASNGVGNGVTGKQPPYYLLTQFPGVTQSRFQLTSALTPTSRQNMAAVLAGVVDKSAPPGGAVSPGGRLKLELLELPRETRTPGPGQAQQAMATDKDAITQINLLKGQGTQAQVVYGNLLSLPYGQGMLYVQPVYVKSANANAYPLMRLVLVSFGSQVGNGPTLTDAINNLLSKSPTTGQPPTGTPPTANPPPTTVGNPVLSGDVAAAAAKIDAAINRLHAAQAAGDFVAQGQALADLDAATKEFQAALAKANGNAPTTTTSPKPTG